MYDKDKASVETALTNANSKALTTSTISTILKLTTSATDNNVSIAQVLPDASGVVTVATGTEVMMITPNSGATIKPPPNVPVVIFTGNTGVSADFSSIVPPPVIGGQQSTRVVVGSAGNDSIILDSYNTKLILGSGDSSIHAGTGNDTIDASLGNATIGGSSFGNTLVTLDGVTGDYKVTVTADHKAVISQFTHSGGSAQGAVAAPATPIHTTTVDHVQYVQLNNNQAIILANDSKQAAVATLYHSVFGRDADAAGMQFWFKAANTGTSLLDIAKGFTSSPEYKALAAQSDDQFLNMLYQNTFNRAADASGKAFWADALAHGHSRAEIIASFAEVAGQNLDGVLHTEAVVVGSVTVVHGII